MSLGKAIKRLRKKQGLNQTEFAELTGLTQTSLSQIETDVNKPHKSTLNTICIALGCSEARLRILSIDKKDIKPDKLEIYEIARDLLALTLK